MEACQGIDATAVAHARAEALVLGYRTKLARYLRRMVGDAEVALDLTQEVFLSAYRMLEADPARELTSGWLYRAATNAGISFLRRRKILRMLPLDREIDGSTWRVDERSAASVDLQAALAQLAPEQSAALLLTSYAGYSSPEAAAILGIDLRCGPAAGLPRDARFENGNEGGYGVTTVQNDCIVAERLAGAIAIGEAGDEERVAYRAHVAACRAMPPRTRRRA